MGSQPGCPSPGCKAQLAGKEAGVKVGRWRFRGRCVFDLTRNLTSRRAPAGAWRPQETPSHPTPQGVVQTGRFRKPWCRGGGVEWGV
jgi:hypothetical protein